ncbi:MAG: EamA family transporter [Firmicutes bacterium]|nr:EamA family transporter [Bacillota bacterium]
MIYLLLAILSSASIALVLKYFKEQEGNRYGIIIGNYLTCIIISLIMVRSLNKIAGAAPQTFACGAVGGILFVLGLVFLQSSVKVNGATLTSAFSKLGVMVPLAFSFLLFKEQPGILQVVGIVIALLALILINSPAKNDVQAKSKDKATYSFALLILTFLGNGLADSMAKVFEQVGPRNDDRVYIFFVFLTAAVISVALAFMEYRKTGKRLLLKELLAGIAVGVPNYFCSFFLLGSLERLPSFLVYPIFSTGTILTVMLISNALFKERLSKKQLAAIGLILLALVMLNI